SPSFTYPGGSLLVTFAAGAWGWDDSELDASGAIILDLWGNDTSGDPTEPNGDAFGRGAELHISDLNAARLRVPLHASWYLSPDVHTLPSPGAPLDLRVRLDAGNITGSNPSPEVYCGSGNGMPPAVLAVYSLRLGEV